MKQKTHHDEHTRFREFQEGQAVWVRNMRGGPPWVRAVVQDRLGPVSYLVRVEGGDLWRRHIDHLRGSTPPRGVDNSVEDLDMPVVDSSGVQPAYRGCPCCPSSNSQSGLTCHHRGCTRLTIFTNGSRQRDCR